MKFFGLVTQCHKYIGPGPWICSSRLGQIGFRASNYTKTVLGLGLGFGPPQSNSHLMIAGDPRHRLRRRYVGRGSAYGLLP